jgi:mannose-6-phosphate isomerase-like protein (cupin superfamily)
MKLQDTFAVLKPDLSVETVDVSPTVYAELDARFDQFKGCVLVSTHEFNADWPTWEIHPSGDEIVVLLSGTATLVLREDDSEARVQLAGPGAYVVVPRNTWHTARVSGTTRMLFITRGEGTENRADPDSPSS